MVDAEVRRELRKPILLRSVPFLGNENNFMTHDECQAMCDELIQDHKPSRVEQSHLDCCGINARESFL